MKGRGADVSPPLWSARAIRGAPELLLRLHRENAEAGADVLTAATFRTHARNLRAAGLDPSEAAALACEAVALARRGADEAGRDVLVAGSVAPLEDCWRPDLAPVDEVLAREHAAHAAALAVAGADLALIETMGTLREARAACHAAAETGLPAIVSFTLDVDGRLLSRVALEEAIRSLLSMPRPPIAIGLNCVPARRLGDALARLHAEFPGVPLVAYGNTGLPIDEERGLFTEPISPHDYAACASEWLALGARLVGGCCGTTAAHTAALRALIG